MIRKTKRFELLEQFFETRKEKNIDAIFIGVYDTENPIVVSLDGENQKIPIGVLGIEIENFKDFGLGGWFSPLEILPEMRNKGYGTFLLDRGLDTIFSISDCNCVGLSTFPDIFPFYERYGFEKQKIDDESYIMAILPKEKWLNIYWKGETLIKD